jgi:glycosyltransferase involved in cell wall biosynthesis
VNGILVPPGDLDALADAILSILLNKDLTDRFRTAGLQTVQELFSWDFIADQFIGAYQTTLDKNQEINSCPMTQKNAI